MGLSAISIREIGIGDGDDDLGSIWPVMVQLRPHLDREAFVELCKIQFDEGFRLVAAFEGEVCRAVAGFRIQHFLHRGKNLYVDDLVSDFAARGRGFGKALLDWLKEEARRGGCANLHLDSGVQRAEAHAFYFAQGLRITSYHFAVDLSGA
jgi:GNAT superfamily N-acetyltransferase